MTIICHKCGLPHVTNPHPDAGKSPMYLEVGCPTECLPCTVLSRHQWAQRAMTAESELCRERARLDWLISTGQIFALVQGRDTQIMAKTYQPVIDPEGYWLNNVEIPDVREAIDIAIEEVKK